MYTNHSASLSRHNSLCHWATAEGVPVSPQPTPAETAAEATPTSVKDFLGKVVIRQSDGLRCTLYEITNPEIVVEVIEPNQYGTHSHYCWRCINIGDNPITTGALVFEDPSLKEPFERLYRAHCLSEDGYWESYGYWMRHD